MKRILTRSGAFVGATATFVVACSDSSSSPSSILDASTTDDAPTTIVDGGTSTDAVAAITPRPELCEGLTPGGVTVEELEYATDPIPPIGGEVLQGTYDLQEANQYDGAADAGDVVSKLSGKVLVSTIVITEFELRMLTATGTADNPEAGDGGVGAPSAQAFLYRTMGTSILGTLVCPSTALPAPMGYSASGNGLALYPDANHRLLYGRRAP